MIEYKQIDSWLMEQGLSAGAYDGGEMLEAFRLEMEAGLTGTSSSLAMLPTYLSPLAEGVEGTVAFVDAGGTNLRTGLAGVDARGQVKLDHVVKRAMPGRDEEVSAEDFYEAICAGLLPVAERFDRIGFCFSYPAEISPNRDGRLLRWTKEIQIPEMVGTYVGADLVAALEQRGAGRKSVTVLNDTTATLLAGCSVGRAFGAEQFVGFILGTGTNCACLYGGQIINMESGNFAAWPCSAVDDRFDSLQPNRGQYRFEKAVSGAYLGPLTLVAMQQAAQESLFSEKGAATIEQWRELDTVSLSMRLAGEAESLCGLAEKDERVMLRIFEALVDRASFFSAVNIAAAMVFDRTASAAPICVNTDGSTFYRTPRLAAQTNAYLRSLLMPYDCAFEMKQVVDSPAVGAAMAAF
ncbi:MAG: hypothetical protein CMF29_00905 [Kiritimatiellaceae bacterium]|nr:hypothetical protein [Kiritimatiellaceae bacterium]